MYPLAPHTMIGQYYVVECKLRTSILLHATKHEYDHYNTVNRIEICLKKWHYVILSPRFVVEHTTESALVCDLESDFSLWFLKTMIPEQTTWATANVVELFLQKLVVLQTIPHILDHEGKMSLFSIVCYSKQLIFSTAIWPSWNHQFHFLFTVTGFVATRDELLLYYKSQNTVSYN